MDGVMAVNEEKIKNMILFFVNKIGKTTGIKLQKGMLLADRICWALYKRSISGLEYVKAQYGPVMEDAGNNILEEMDKSIITVLPQENAYIEGNDYKVKVRITNAMPNMAIFSNEEIALLERACKIIREHTDKELVEMTHDKAWKNAKLGEVLSYDSCIHEKITEKTIKLTLALK